MINFVNFILCVFLVLILILAVTLVGVTIIIVVDFLGCDIPEWMRKLIK